MSGSVVLRARLGAQLRAYRESARMGIEQAASKLDREPSTISRRETGKITIRDSEIKRMLRLYGVTDREAVAELLAMNAESKTAGWWDQYRGLPSKYSAFIEYEQTAVRALSFEPQLIPGLLQTREYAAETIRKGWPGATAEQIEEYVELRMQRQAVLTRTDRPLHLNTVVDEGVLWRQVGGPAAMKRQIAHLLELSELPNVRVQLSPFDRGAPVCLGTFVLLDFDGAAETIVYCESSGGDLYVEDAGAVEGYRDRHDELVADALGRDDTADRLHQIMTNHNA